MIRGLGEGLKEVGVLAGGEAWGRLAFAQSGWERGEECGSCCSD